MLRSPHRNWVTRFV